MNRKEEICTFVQNELHFKGVDLEIINHELLEIGNGYFIYYYVIGPFEDGLYSHIRQILEINENLVRRCIVVIPPMKMFFNEISAGNLRDAKNWIKYHAEKYIKCSEGEWTDFKKLI